MGVDRLYEWQYLLVGVAGLGLTVALAGPGEHSVAVGPLGVDPFYAVDGCFTFLAGWSAYALWQSPSSD